MNPKTFIVIFALSFALVSLAQDANTLITQGRAFLAQKNLTNANARFQAAVQIERGNQNANVFLGATRLLTLVDQPAGKAFLDRLGFAPTNRSFYGWTAGLARDTNGVVLAPANMSASEITAFLRTNVLLEMAAAADNLAKVADTNFTLTLASNETTIAEVTLDYGDVLLVRAGLEFAEYLGYTIHSWNLDAQLTAIRSLLTNSATTTEGFLAQFRLHCGDDHRASAIVAAIAPANSRSQRSREQAIKSPWTGMAELARSLSCASNRCPCLSHESDEASESLAR